MFVNNEIGYIFDVKKLFEIVKKKNLNVIVYIDVVQVFMKEKINVKELNVDFMLISGYKIYVLKGIGVLYIRKGVNF